MGVGDDYVLHPTLTESMLRIAENDRDFWKEEYRRLLTKYNQKWGDDISVENRVESVHL